MDSHLTGAMSAGVPHGPVLGPLLFLIYINDVTMKLKSDCLLYAHDTSLFDIVDDPVTSNNDLTAIEDWARKWLVTINPTKTECMTFSVKRIKPPHPDLFYGDQKIIEVSQHFSTLRCCSLQQPFLCFLIVGIHASGFSIPLSLLMLSGWSLMWI